MGWYGEQGRGLQRIIGPAGTGCSPVFDKVPNPGSGRKDQKGRTIIGGGEDEIRAIYKRHDGQGFIQTGPDKRQHQDIERRQDNPVQGFKKNRF